MLQITQVFKNQFARIMLAVVLSLTVVSQVIPVVSGLGEVVYADECDNSSC